MSEEAVRAHFETQADACARLGSPFTARLLTGLGRSLDMSTKTGSKVLAWGERAGPDALALRLAGALHRLVLEEADTALAAVYPPAEADTASLTDAALGAITRHDQLVAAMLDGAPQTNEVGRSAMLLPGYLAIARETGLPLDLCEIGASAGLNLNFDRFRYTYGDREWGEAASPVALAPEIRGAIPPLNADIEIAARGGCDVMPADAADPHDRLRLMSYVWADQTARMARLEAAIAIAALSGTRVEWADAADYVAARLADRRDGTVFVLSHSIMWQYMDRPTRRGIEASMRAAGEAATAAAPLAHLRMEPLAGPDGFATLILTTWPGDAGQGNGQGGETRHLARCDFHGRWIEWLAA